MHDDNKDVIN